MKDKLEDLASILAGFSRDSVGWQAAPRSKGGQLQADGAQLQVIAGSVAVRIDLSVGKKLSYYLQGGPRRCATLYSITTPSHFIVLHPVEQGQAAGPRRPRWSGPKLAPSSCTSPSSSSSSSLPASSSSSSPKGLIDQSRSRGVEVTGGAQIFRRTRALVHTNLLVSILGFRRITDFFAFLSRLPWTARSWG